jgi:hypothetical protein
MMYGKGKRRSRTAAPFVRAYVALLVQLFMIWRADALRTIDLPLVLRARSH